MGTEIAKETHTADVYEPGIGVGSAEIYIDPVKERRMMRKFDVRWHQVQICVTRLSQLHY